MIIHQDTRELFRPYTDAETFAQIREMDSVSEMWTHCVSSYADRIAIEDNGKAYTYADIEKDAASFRPLLLNEQYPKGSKIGIFAPNSYAFVKSFISITTSGLTAVVLPPHLDEKTVFGCCMKFQLKAIVYAPEMEEKIRFAAQNAPLVKMLPFDACADSVSLAVSCNASDPCAVMFTGGTTGRSKGALLSNGAIMQGVVNGCYGTKDVFFQRYLLILPLSHVFGLIRNLLVSLYTGSNMFICRNNKDMFANIAAFRPTIMVMVPALAEMALTLSRKLNRNMLGDSLKCIICGAAPVPHYLVEEYKKFNISFLPGYGLTESANLVSGNPIPDKKVDSVGIPYPNQDFRIENGELWLKGKNMMDCYVGDEGENASAYEDGWFKTGDLVSVDEDGFLYITGRIKEIIVLPSGENISPAELELQFNELACIQDSQVFEDVDENGQHILSLEVVPRMTELSSVPADQLASYITSRLEEVNRSLPPFQRVSKIVIRDTDFARTPSMKIVRYHKV